MRIVFMLCNILPWYIYLLGGLAISLYLCLDSHIKMKEALDKAEEDKYNATLMQKKLFKKRCIVICIITMLLAITFAIFSYIGALNL